VLKLDISERSEIPESFVASCWRTMENITWVDHVRNEEVLQRVKEEKNPTSKKYEEDYLD